MVKIIRYLLITALTSWWAVPQVACGQSFSHEDFRTPAVGFRPRPLWFWNNTTITEDGALRLIGEMHDNCGYGGFGIVPFGKDFRPEYLSEDYFRLYGKVLEKAGELGMKVSLYDEYGFPSGSVGAFDEGDNNPRFQKKYPDDTIERLDKSEETITGPAEYKKQLPGGRLMGAVAMENTTLKRIDITSSVKNGKLQWKVPAGTWKIMIFTCLTDGIPISDYLDPQAARYFTGMVHDLYYARFKEYFGPVIYGTFFDEPSMFHARFRMWTQDFNEKFTAKFGYSPVSLYPALWYDIGSDTRSARCCLFGFRAELYAEGFTRVVNDWSLDHGITATGHTAPEEALVPANSAGDLMKSFRYLEIPGIDKIGGHRPAERFYKLVSSSAYNWDRSIVMSETYGAMPDYSKPGDLTWDQIDSIAIDQYSKGINMLIPHAVWYDDTKVTYKPELSHRNPLYAGGLKNFTELLSRLNVMLQPAGRHVADIAILYPVSSLLAEHYFYEKNGPANIDGWVDPSNEFYKAAVRDIDYIDVAGWLTNSAGKDFTFLHPEVLDEKCVIENGTLHLSNKIDPEKFRIIIVPSCGTISVSNMMKIADFYKSGGMVIFTTRLPFSSAETGRDKDIAGLVRSVIPDGEKDALRIIENGKGGKACFIPAPDGPGLREVLDRLYQGFDVTYPFMPGLQYIHKVVGGRNIYFFANTGGTAVNSPVRLLGQYDLELWNPHTGSIDTITSGYLTGPSPDLKYTEVAVDLKPFRSCFLVEKKNQ